MLPPESDQELPTVASTADATTAVPPGSPVPGPGMLTVGQSLGTRYRILALLGRGGMGAVYKAWDDELGLAVALKTILLAPGTDGDTATLLARRFKREALLARQITHQNVVRVHDFGEFEGVKYLTMAFVEGETLSDLMRRRDRLEPREVVPLARQIAEGLSAAHRAGVVHRDLKPANIMITPAGEACIMDFGIARSANTTVTQAGVVVGTLEYMAPEQLLGAAADEVYGRLRPRADSVTTCCSAGTGSTAWTSPCWRRSVGPGGPFLLSPRHVRTSRHLLRPSWTRPSTPRPISASIPPRPCSTS